jgi:tetratricopeptide (TPR) repeat protein
LLEQGLTLLREQKTKEARPHLVKAAELSGKLYPPHSKENSELLNTLGRHFENGEDLETALGFYLKAYQVDKVLHEKDEELLASHSNRIGAILADLGELEKAQEYLESILKTIEKSSNNELKAAYFGNLGHVKMRLSDQQAGLENFLKAKELQIALDPKDEILVKYLQSIGMCYWVRGDFSQAKESFEEALEFLSVDPEKYCFGMVDVYSHLGYLHNDMKMPDEAFKYFEYAISTFESTKIPEKTTKILEFIKNVVEAMKSVSEAQASRYINLYLTFSRKYFGENSRETAEGYNMYSALWLKQKAYKDALEYAEKSINICKTLQDNHYDLLQCFNQFAQIMHKMGELEAASRFLAQSGEILENHPNEKMKTSHYHNLALLNRDQRKYSEAESNMLLHIKGVRDQFGEQHPAMASAYLNIGHIYRVSKNYPNAKEYYSKALSVFDATLGREHLNTADTLEFLGEVCRLSESFHEALDMHNESLRIRVKFVGLQHPTLHIPYFNLASTYMEMENFSQAEVFALKRLEILKKYWGNDSVNVAGNHSFLAEVYLSQGQKSKAVQSLEETLRILKTTGNQEAINSLETRLKDIKNN